MFNTIAALIPRDVDFPARTRRLDLLTRVLEGTLYDALPYEFHEERTADGRYIPLRSRRPSVRYPLARIVVEDSLSLVFGEGHFPALTCGDEATRMALGGIMQDARLNAVMQEAALRGAVGSVAILLRVLAGRVFCQVMQTLYLTPVFQPLAPDTLARVGELRKVTGAELRARGYRIADPAGHYWFRREWDDEWERWFVPVPAGGGIPRETDEGRSVRHGLGFVPIVWIRNLPGGDGIDGGCTFHGAVETQIEIDYQLSQAGRGLKYSSDPTLMIREPAALDGELVRGAGNALVVGENGDAKLLEIAGSAAGAVTAYVRTLREFALEGMHGNRASADRLTAPQSGRALELMNLGLIWLADNLRVSYGGGLLDLLRMIVAASAEFPLRTPAGPVGRLAMEAAIGLRWPHWYPPDPTDRNLDAQTLATLTGAGLVSRATAVGLVADDFGIADVPAELARIANDSKDAGHE